jgi:alanine racemase
VCLAAVAANLHTLQALALPADVCAVVKANAYGHGAEAVARRLEAEGCRRFAVGTLDEGLELRGAGVGGEVWLLQGAGAEQLGILRAARLTPVVASLRALDALGERADRLDPPLAVHVKFDTGMCRLGLGIEEVGALAEILRCHPGLRLEGVATHFARAGESAEVTREQIRRFDTILAALASLGIDPPVVHAANSAACLTEPSARYTCVRVGIALYGVPPEPGLESASALRPALSWVSAVEHLREVPAGVPVSYGGTFVTDRPSRLAVIPVGYADGYRRALGNRAEVLVRGRPAPVVGRVTMDLSVADVTDLPEVAEGDEVVLLGTRGARGISAGRMADWLDTIPYEVLCGIGPRVPRVYEGGP